MHVIDNSSLPHATLPGIDHTTLAGSIHGLKALSVWRQRLAGGAATPPHRHDCEEVIVVVSGEGELHIGGAIHRFGADTTLVIPPNVDHQIFNTGTAAMETVAVFSTSPVEVVLPDGQPLALPWLS